MARMKKKASSLRMRSSVALLALFFAGLLVAGAFGEISPITISTSTGDSTAASTTVADTTSSTSETTSSAPVTTDTTQTTTATTPTDTTQTTTVPASSGPAA